MKNIETSKLLSIAFSVLLLLSCGGQSPAPHEPSTEHGDGTEFTSTYVCPMHCPGSGSGMEGICQICGMNYVLLTEHSRNGHVH